MNNKKSEGIIKIVPSIYKYIKIMILSTIFSFKTNKIVCNIQLHPIHGITY